LGIGNALMGDQEGGAAGLMAVLGGFAGFPAITRTSTAIRLGDIS
jgi:hypothetical protein